MSEFLIVEASPSVCAATTDRHHDRRDRALDPFTNAVTAWIQGYFAGAGALSFGLIASVDGKAHDNLRSGYRATASMLDAEEIPKWLDAYCPSHADEQLSVVMLRLLRTAYGL